MADAPAAVAKTPCCVCDAPGGKHCTKCKSRHYCSKACQLVDWNEGGHKAQCKQMAAESQNRLLDELMPAKLKIKEEPAIVEDVPPAAGSRAVARVPAALTEKTPATKASALNETPDWLGTCAICLDVLPFKGNQQSFYPCCCKRTCKECNVKCRQYDDRCPLCRAPPSRSEADWLRRVQKHADEGNAEAQFNLADYYVKGCLGLKKNLKQGGQLFERAAVQGYPLAQNALGRMYMQEDGVELNYETGALWIQRAAEQGYPDAQSRLGNIFNEGKGVAQSLDDAVKWWRLAAAQGQPNALYDLGVCYTNGEGAPLDYHYHEALCLFKRAAAKGHPDAAD